MSKPTDTRPPDPRLPDPLSGILVVDKPLGMMSTHVCNVVKRALIAGGAPRSVRVGHGGTLDPLATGVLVVLVGRATRLSERIMAGEKRYQAEVDLSQTSTTDDYEGRVTPLPVLVPPTRERVGAACAGFVGEIEQAPPAHSALKVGGRPAYALARRGRDPGLSARRVTIHEIRVVAYAWPILRVEVRCGKGVYVRSLARDIGRALGTGGMLSRLRRTAVGPFSIDGALDGERIPAVLTAADLRPIPPEDR